jgi:quercetin dioxygenase-like cupin family protein
MTAHVLTLFEEGFAAAARVALPATPRVLYVAAGEIEVTSPAGQTRIEPQAAWHGTAACSVTAGARGASLLRYELRRLAPTGATASAPGVVSALSLEHPIALDAGQAYLMRCDRVDFAPGGEALPHGHRGGGIRRLLEGALEVRVGDRAGRVMRPGDAWFESGAEPVHAIAAREAPTSFVRVSILPRELRGRSSIVYVDPAHASGKPRRYTIHVDDPIELP